MSVYRLRGEDFVHDDCYLDIARRVRGGIRILARIIDGIRPGMPRGEACAVCRRGGHRAAAAPPKTPRRT